MNANNIHKILCAAFAIVIGLTACKDNVSPTKSEWNNLLDDATNVPDLGPSNFGKVFLLSTKGPVKPRKPVGPYTPTWLPPDDRDGFTHITTGPDKTKYHPKDSVHIEKGANATKYAPGGWEHIAKGKDKSKYKPGGWEHVQTGGSEGSNNTKYRPTGYEHITRSGQKITQYKPVGWKHIGSGENKTKYQSPDSDIAPIF